MYYPSTVQAPHPWGCAPRQRRPDPDIVERDAVARAVEYRWIRDHLVNDLGVERELVKAVANDDLADFLDRTVTDQSGNKRLTVIGCNADHGSVVLFDGVDDKDLVHTFAVERRYAADLYEAVLAGEDADVEVESWQLFGQPRPLSVVQAEAEEEGR